MPMPNNNNNNNNNTKDDNNLNGDITFNENFVSASTDNHDEVNKEVNKKEANDSNKKGELDNHDEVNKEANDSNKKGDSELTMKSRYSFEINNALIEYLTNDVIDFGMNLSLWREREKGKKERKKERKRRDLCSIGRELF
jgi:hypothetical protein